MLAFLLLARRYATEATEADVHLTEQQIQAREDAADILLEKIAPLVVDESPDIIGVVLARLIADYLACINPGIREKMFAWLKTAIEDMTKDRIGELIERGTIPESWRGDSRRTN